MDFAIVDLASQKVVGSHSMPGGIQFIALDEKYVFVIPPNPHVLVRLDRADLSRSRRVLLGGTPMALAATPDKCVAMEVNDGGGFLLRVLDRQTLQPNNRDDGDPASRDGGNRSRSFSPYNRSGSLPLAEPLGDGAVQQLDRILEADTGELRCLLFGGNLPDLLEFAARGINFPGAYRARAPRAGGRQLWGRAIVNNQLTMAQGKAVATLPPGERSRPTIRWPPDSTRPGRAAAKRPCWSSSAWCWAKWSDPSTSAEPAATGTRRERLFGRHGGAVLCTRAHTPATERAKPG